MERDPKYLHSAERRRLGLSGPRPMTGILPKLTSEQRAKAEAMIAAMRGEARTVLAGMPKRFPQITPPAA